MRSRSASRWAEPGPATPDLFACPTCPAYGLCGGDRTSPCGCVPEMRAERACGRCHLVCSERRVEYSTDFHDARHALRAGMSLDALVPSGLPVPVLPTFVPLETNQLPHEHGLDLEWAGMRLQRWIGATHPLHVSARVAPGTRLVAVANGSDALLERLWRMGAEARTALWGRLRAEGVEVLTGPTFSVVHDTPALHRFVSLSRHHRIVQEASDAGLAVAPNLYWANARSHDHWAEWLAAHPGVTAVSRDVTRNSSQATHQRIRSHLLGMLARSSRPFQVLLTGVGASTAPAWAAALREHGHTAVLLTSDPTAGSRRSGRRYRSSGGTLRREATPSASPKDEIVVGNVAAFLEFAAGL